MRSNLCTLIPSYMDFGAPSVFIPRTEFYGYLQRLINAGLENPIMFGSDQMVWPDAITVD